eukprot:jgi/Tetstr1/457824/TSEL_044369.t1
MALGKSAAALVLVLLWGAICRGENARTEERLRGSAHQPTPRWQLEWRPRVTVPPRRLVPLRWNYIKPETCEPWLDCVRKHKLLDTLQLTPWPPGTKVLFIGNSFVRQLAETAVLDVPEGEIKTMLYPNTFDRKSQQSCLCPLSDNGPGNVCEFEDVLSLSPDDARGPLRIDGVQYCDSWYYNGTALKAYHDSSEVRFCSDDRAVVQLYDGGVIAQVINHQTLFKVPLEEGVLHATGMPLSAFDVLIANQANPAKGYYHLCDGDMGPLPGPEASSLLYREQYEVMRTCGAPHSVGGHACMPGPTLWMAEALRAEYVASRDAAGKL